MSDNFNDQRNSVYSKKAALERKIEILSVSNAEHPKDTVVQKKADETSFDFGKIKPGKKYSHDFFITNTSKMDIYIKSVEPSCGCTVANWTKTAIHPNEQGKVSITFDSTGKTGKQDKQIVVYLGDNSTPIVLSFTADIK